MSADAAMETPKARKSKTPKEITSVKSSKKRSREEAATTSAVQEPSPSKKQRTSTEEITSTQIATLAADDLDTRSPFVKQTTSLYLPLTPVAYNYPIQGLCAEHLSPYLLSYYPPLDGILLSYSNPRLSASPHNVPSSVPSDVEPSSAPIVLAQSIDEYGVSFAWLTADFTLLRPARDSVIEAQVRVQNPSYLGLVCWNFFNGSIERRRLPADWKWVTSDRAAAALEDGAEEADDEAEGDTGEGYWVNAEGEKVEGMIRFRVRDFESAPMTERERGFINIEGTLLGPEDDKKVDDEIKEKMRDKSKGRRLSRLSSGAGR